MFNVDDRRLSRNEFLKTAAGLAGGMLISLDNRLASADEPAIAGSEGAGCPLRLALLSDTHVAADPGEVYRDFNPSENLQEVVKQVQIAQPQAALINGDAARLVGDSADYRQLQSLLEPIARRAPIGIGLGNHDDRQNFRKVFAEPIDRFSRQRDVDKHVLVMEHAWLRVIMLDSLLYVDRVAGLLGQGQRNWLARFLTEQDNRPTVLFVHHTLGDRDGDLLDFDRFHRIIEPHWNVKAIFYGHSHCYEYGRLGRLHLVNLPAVGYNFDDDQPVGWLDATFNKTGCDLTLRAIHGNTSGDGQTVSLDWEG